MTCLWLLHNNLNIVECRGVYDSENNAWKHDNNLNIVECRGTIDVRDNIRPRIII